MITVFYPFEHCRQGFERVVNYRRVLLSVHWTLRDSCCKLEKGRQMDSETGLSKKLDKKGECNQNEGLCGQRLVLLIPLCNFSFYFPYVSLTQ